jgi:large subunit ribosomal protein L9
MKVILTEKIEAVGQPGDLLTVKDGYARNYLLPNNKAVQATTQNMKQLEHQKRFVGEKLNKIKSEAEKLAKKLDKTSCTITKPAGEEDKLFGSVTSADIYESLKNEGIEIDKKKISLDAPLKELGIFNIPVKLHPEITATLKVWVVKE